MSGQWSARIISTAEPKGWNRWITSPAQNLRRFLQTSSALTSLSKGTYDKDIKGSVLIRTDEVTLKNMTVDGDLIIGCGAADGKITLDNVTVKGRSARLGRRHESRVLQ